MSFVNICDMLRSFVEETEVRLKYSTDIRPNYILIGPVASGKSEVAKLLASRVDGLYISFIKEYGKDFLNQVDYLDVDGIDLLEYIKEEILDAIETEVIIIDGIEFLLNQIYTNGDIESFLEGYSRMIFNKKVVMVLSDFYVDGSKFREDMCFKIKKSRGG